MRSRDERWLVTIWQPERPQSNPTAGTNPPVAYNDAIDHKLRRRECEVFAEMSLQLGLRDRPIYERAVLINGRLVTVRKQRQED